MVIGIVAVIAILAILTLAMSSKKRKKERRGRTTTNDYGLYDTSNPLSPWNAKDPGHTTFDGGDFGGGGASGDWGDIDISD